jgi:hypothetical protein
MTKLKKLLEKCEKCRRNSKKCLDWKQVAERAKDSYELEMTAIKYTSFQNNGNCKEGWKRQEKLQNPL